VRTGGRLRLARRNDNEEPIQQKLARVPNYLRGNVDFISLVKGNPKKFGF
jgi:hypothetical protein